MNIMMQEASSSEPRSVARIPSMTQNEESRTPAGALQQQRSTVTPTPRKLSTEELPWPPQSSTSLPALSSSLIHKFSAEGLNFPINEECTSLRLTPSGRLLIAGFTDGTVRLFDLTGRFNKQTSSNEPLQKRHGAIVDSKFHQRYGAVACQIHAKGVHTSLRMDVDVTPDGLWCFAGVLRGSMELVAVHLGHLERAYDNPNETNLLDHLTVHRHGDAKLRGFGACTRLKTKTPKYLLFTGKAIKNIHIWSFEPRPNNQEPIWTQLYDTQTNGNTIKLLQFRHNPAGHLQAISKSDGQKLRVWDLQLEEQEENSSQRPSRPPFQDVVNTEATLGIAGGFCLCGGSELYNQMSIVSLDVDNLQSSFNHTELALPGATPSVRRRQQRGDLKCIQDIAGMDMDAGQALLELSDGSIVQYTQNEVGLPMLQVKEAYGVLEEGVARKLCVGRIGSVGLAVSAVATYNPLTGKGGVRLQALDKVKETMTPRSGFWGFAGQPALPDPLPTPKTNRNPESAKKDDLHTIAANIHPVTTARKPNKSSQPMVSSTAKKSFAEARKSILTPQFAKDITVKLDNHSKRKAEKESPRVSVDIADAAKLSGNAKKVSTEQKASPKYLKTADGSKQAMHDAGDQVKREPAKENRVNKNETSRTLQTIHETPTKEYSPPVPRKRSLSEHISEINKGHALVDVASTLCKLGTSPVPYKPELQPPSFSSRLRSPGPKRKKDTPETRAAIQNACKEQVAKVKAMLEEIPKTTVSYRLGLQSSIVKSVADAHELARRKMAAEHLASHERMCKKVLRATLSSIQGIHMSPSEAAMDKARKALENDLRACYEMTQEMIQRQEMEASSLAAQQTFEQQGKQAPCLSVAFAFPHIFEQAIDCLPQIDY